MKNSSSFLTMTLAVLSLGSLGLAQTPCPGDVDGDARRTVRDAVRLISHVSSKSQLQGAGFEAADVNADGSVNVADLVRLFRHVAAIETLSPCIAPSGPPEIDGFTPSSATIGTAVTIVGRNFAPVSGGAPRVSMSRQGGGLIAAPVASSTNERIVFVVPTSAASGPLTVSLAATSATSADSLEIVPSSDFRLSAAPASLSLIQGQSAVYSISLTSSNGFSQLAALTASDLPQGVTASFSPPQISAGQFSMLTLTASPQQPVSEGSFAVTASANVDGMDLTQSVPLGLNVERITTSFMGRTVVADTLQTPLAGVTVTILGRDGEGNATACSGQTISDAAGNFAFTNLPAGCVGPQLIRYDGLTATFPPGEYAGVDLIYTIVADQVTESPVLIHLPRIDNAETVYVIQNHTEDQHFTFRTVPNLSATVYAGTFLTLVDGRRPDPFPLVAVDVPIDRLPDQMPPSTTTVEPFIVAFQPANANASQPVAVSFPNNINTPPGTNMELSTLDPTRGVMVVYGTGTVSPDGRQIVPDFNPATPGMRFGLVNFDWHGPRQPQPPGKNPCPPGSCCPTAGNPVGISSGLHLRTETDIEVNGARGRISIQRTYRTQSLEAGPFGIGSSHNYGHRLDTNRPLGAAVINLVMPDGNRLPFTFDGVDSYTNETIPGLRGAAITVSADGAADLRWKDGTVFHFVPSTALLGSVLDAISDANGNRTSLIRNPARPVQIVEVIDPVGRKLLLNYDAIDRVTLIVDPMGRRVRYSYNVLGTLATVTDPEGGVTRYDYAAADRLTRVTDARGVVVSENTYDANGRIIQQEQADTGVITFAYTLLNPDVPDSPVQKTVVTDAMGQRTTYRFDPQGFLTDVTDAAGQTRIFDREPGTNLPLAIRGPGTCAACGSTSAGDASFTYDGNGNVLSRTDALGNTTIFTYEPVFNQVASMTDPLGNTTIFSYDASGNLLTRTDENSNTTTFAYNQFGQVTETTDPLGHTSTFGYDAFGNLVEATDPLRNTTRHRHDAVSRRIETIDALGGKTKTAFDKLDRVVRVTDARGNTTRTEYDEVGNRISVTDARGNPISFVYDETNRLRTRIDSRGNADSRSYDLNGNLTRFVDRRGQAATFTYDELNRLSTESYQDGSTVTRRYDLLGRLVQANDSSGGTFSFSYDAAGRLLSSVGPFGTVDYARDTLGRTTRRQVVGQPAVDYTYDPVGNLLSAAMPRAGVANFYDARNQIVNQTRSNGVESDYVYDAASRLVSLTHHRGSRTLESLTYTYDAVGNKILRTSANPQPLITQASVNQHATDSNLLEIRGLTSYTYDENGNRLTATGRTGTITYTWDARNRLESIETPKELMILRYDFAGNLVGRDTGRPESVFRGSRQAVLDELTNVVFESENERDQFSILTGQSIDQHLATLGTDSAVRFALTDALNSTVLTVDGNGKTIGNLQYEPFGETISLEDVYPFQYTGRVQITGNFYHYRARYYDSLAGIFVSEDPAGLADGPNLYVYVDNNPVKNTDPLGLQSNAGVALRECANSGSGRDPCGFGENDPGRACRDAARDANDCSNGCCRNNCSQVAADYVDCCDALANYILKVLCWISTCGDPLTLCK